jgi:hypothetical protein
MKLNKQKKTTTYVTGVVLTPQEFLKLVADRNNELLVELPGSDDEGWYANVTEEITWDGTSFVIKFGDDPESWPVIQ